jgi:predicted XRE-type DNA-binding protein
MSYILSTSAIELMFYGVSQSPDYKDRRVAIIASNLPFLVGIVVCFLTIYLGKQLLYKKSPMKFRQYFRAVMGPFNLVLQLTSVFFFAYGVDLANKKNPNFAGLICASYPIVIGLQKTVLFAIVEPFEMEEVYEFASLAFAAMPYRLIYLSLDQWFQAGILFAIKYIYKFLVYFITLKNDKWITNSNKKIKGKLMFWKNNVNKVTSLENNDSVAE